MVTSIAAAGLCQLEASLVQRPFGRQCRRSAETRKDCRLSQRSHRRAATVASASREESASEAPLRQDLFAGLGKAAVSALAAAALLAGQLPSSSSEALAATSPFPSSNAAISELAVLTAGNPQKDARALLRNALPINNQAIQDVQRALENITEAIRLPGARAVDASATCVRQATRAFTQNRTKILADIAPNKADEGKELVNKLSESLTDFATFLQTAEKSKIAAKQREVLAIVGDIEEAMVASFPYEIPKEYASMPWLRGRASLEMKVVPRNNPNVKDYKLQLVVDGYNAPITAGNFVDLVGRKFYDGMEIQRADGFVVQTGDPEGPEEGFVDPATGKLRIIPLEIKVQGDVAPIYEETLEELGRYKALCSLPFNAFGTLAMAREEFSNNSASSQIFWLLKESELTPSSANILDGRYSVFGYVVQNEDFLADLKVGDKIEYIKVTQGLDNLQNPSF